MSMSKKQEVQVSSYSRRLKDNIKSILENYGEILKASKVSLEDSGKRTTEAHVAHIDYDVSVKAANIVRAAASLSKLVSDLKETLILNDLSSINEVTTRRTEELQKLLSQQQKELNSLYMPAEQESGTSLFWKERWLVDVLPFIIQITGVFWHVIHCIK